MSAIQLEVAAAVLGPILEEVVFVGRATIHLWLTEPAAPPVRATDDVDVICEVSTRAEYHSLGVRLRERGLAEARDEPVICRWRSTDPRLVLDVMPTAGKGSAKGLATSLRPSGASPRSNGRGRGS